MEKQDLLATDRLILGIETSCDETAVAVVANGNRILSNLVFRRWSGMPSSGVSFPR